MPSTAQLRTAYPEFVARWPTATTDPRCDFSTAVPVVFYAGPPDYPAGRVVLKVHPATRQIWRAQAAVMLAHRYAFREKAGGTLSCRKITGGTGTTLHLHGIAKDDNPSKNGYRTARGALDEPDTGHKEGVLQWGKYTDMPARMVRDIEAITLTNGRHPFEWGGRWWNIKDPMHWELDVLQNQLAPLNLASLPANAWTNYLAFENQQPLPNPPGDEQMLDAHTPSPSEAVADYQRSLIELGYNLGAFPPFAAGYPPGADGDYGTTTRDATTAFQTDFGLHPTGDGDGVTVATVHDFAARNRGAGGTVDQTARSAAASAATQAAAARGRADAALESADRANQTLDKIRSE